MGLLDKIKSNNSDNEIEELDVSKEDVKEDGSITKMYNTSKEKIQDSMNGLDVISSLKGIARTTVKTVNEINDELESKNEAFTIDDFSLSVTLGAPRIEVKFRKKRISKEEVKLKSEPKIESKKEPKQKAEVYHGNCKACNFQWQVNKNLVVGKQEVKLRCASCKDIFSVDGSGKLIEKVIPKVVHKEQPLSDPFISNCPECSHITKIPRAKIGTMKKATLTCKSCKNKYSENFI